MMTRRLTLREPDPGLLFATGGSRSPGELARPFLKDVQELPGNVILATTKDEPKQARRVVSVG
jgi:hypothetical protein